MQPCGPVLLRTIKRNYYLGPIRLWYLRTLENDRFKWRIHTSKIRNPHGHPLHAASEKYTANNKKKKNNDPLIFSVYCGEKTVKIQEKYPVDAELSFSVASPHGSQTNEAVFKQTKWNDRSPPICASEEAHRYRTVPQEEANSRLLPGILMASTQSQLHRPKKRIRCTIKWPKAQPSKSRRLLCEAAQIQGNTLTTRRNSQEAKEYCSMNCRQNGTAR